MTQPGYKQRPLTFATARLAFRNLGRNRRRTVITGAALAVGMSLSVAGFGLMDGMNAELLNALTRFDLGHIQVHHPDYTGSRALADTVPGRRAALAELAQADATQSISERLYAYGLASNGAKSTGVQLVGVDPEREIGVTVVHERIRDGDYLAREPTSWPRGRELTGAELAADAEITADVEASAIAEIEALEALASDDADDDATEAATAIAEPSSDTTTAKLARIQSPPPERPPRVIMGAKLARVLGVDVGDQLVASTQAIDGVAEETLIEVHGIFQTGTTGLDRNRLYLHLADLQRFTHLYDRVHEIAIAVDQPDRATEIAHQMQAGVSAAGSTAAVESWSELRPDIHQMLEITRLSTGVMIFIIFIVATLGVVNTMLMAVFERTRELGMLKAIGMSGFRIVGLIVTETVLLVLLASLVGTVLGVGLDLYMVHYGVDLSSYTAGFSIGGVGINPILHGQITPHGVILPTVLLSACCLVASLYPAIRAARLRPAVGMRET